MSSSMWRRIRRFVEEGKETPKVDLKEKLELSSRKDKAEFVKDVTAIANTRGKRGYLIIGVKDSKDCPREGASPEDYVVGFSPADADELQRQMWDALRTFCDPLPDVSMEILEHPEIRRQICVIIIEAGKRPHKIIRSSEGIEQEDVFVRRGTATFRAKPEEIIAMAQEPDLTNVILINLSSHPLTDTQKEQLENQYRLFIEELIEVPVHFNPEDDLQKQVKQTLDRIGLAPEEWSDTNICLILPGIAPPAAAVLATVHGLRGGFPKLVWIYQSPHDRTLYTVSQVIDLQALRDWGRQIRVGGI